MNKLTLALALTCAALIGCVASTLIIPPVRAGTSPIRWEYLCVESGDDVNAFWKKANKAGKHGWELAAASVSDGGNTGSNDAFWCFKRAL